MDNLYQERLEKSADKKEVNVSLDDDGIMKVLMCCQAGRSCRKCPYDELDSPRCRDILLNECIGLVNRLKKAKEDIAREIFEEIENALELLRIGVKEGQKNDGIKYQQLHDGRILSIEAIKYFTAELKKKYTESEKDNGN